jgi:hypothetical protein
VGDNIYRKIYYGIVHIANGSQQTCNLDRSLPLLQWVRPQTNKTILPYQIRYKCNTCFKINMLYDRDRFICASSSSFSVFRRTVLSQ